MHISVPGRLARTLRVFVLVALAVALAASSVLAAHQTGMSGSIGSVAFNDGVSNPGARCSYQGAAGTLYFSGVKVKGPQVQWPDQVADVAEHGWVAFRIRIDHFNGVDWSVVKTSAPTKTKVWDDHYTQLAAKSLSWGGPNNHQYRASVTLKFIKPNGTTIGRATYVIDNHRRGYDNSVGAGCVGRHPNLG